MHIFIHNTLIFQQYLQHVLAVCLPSPNPGKGISSFRTNFPAIPLGLQKSSVLCIVNLSLDNRSTRSASQVYLLGQCSMTPCGPDNPGIHKWDAYSAQVYCRCHLIPGNLFVNLTILTTNIFHSPCIIETLISATHPSIFRHVLCPTCRVRTKNTGSNRGVTVTRFSN